MAPKYMLIVLSVVCFVHCENVNMNGTKQLAQDSESSLRKSRELGSYAGLISCAVKYDVSCFVDAAEDFLEVRRTELLGEADAEALQSTGRSDPDSKPSHLANTLNRLISELTGMFQNNLFGLVNAGREATDDDDDDDDEEEEGDDDELTDTTSKDSVGEMRLITNIRKKKKKKKPLKSLIRLIKVAIIALIVVFKLGIILKALQTAMQFKFLLISLGGFAIQAAKFWMNIRNKKEHGHEEIIYKNPYSSTDEYVGPGGSPYGGEYNAARSTQEIAYSSYRNM